MIKKKNIILILILIVLSIFLVQYWSKQQEQVEKERLEQIEKEIEEKEKWFPALNGYIYRFIDICMPLQWFLLCKSIEGKSY